MAEMGRDGPVVPFVAKAATAQYRFVKHGDADDNVQQGAAAADKLIGVSVRPAPADGPIDVKIHGLFRLEFGAAVARGDLLKSDANGKGIPVSAANDRYGGVAMQSGVAGDVGDVNIVIGVR